MSKEEVLSRVNEIFKDAFDREDLRIGYETTAADVEGWDSLMQMNLIEMIEDDFGIRFSMEEVINMQNVGAMLDVIMTKL